MALAENLAGWRRSPTSPPRILGHRGAHGSATENTLQAFELAMNQGAAGVELDVRLSCDGVVVVLHDRDLSRVMGGQSDARPERSSLMALKSHDLGGGARIPTLDEVLDWARQRSAVLNVELKQDVLDRSELVRAVTRTLHAAQVSPEMVLLSSFDPLIVRRLGSSLPEFLVGYLVDRSSLAWPMARRFASLGARAVHPHEGRVTARFMRTLARRGALVNVYGVNDETRALELSALGVDTIITDVPGRILRALTPPAGMP